MKHKTKVISFRVSEHDYELLQHYKNAMKYVNMTQVVDSLLSYGVLFEIGKKEMKRVEAKAKRDAKKVAAGGL